MTTEEKIANVRARIGGDNPQITDELIAVYLLDAKDAVLKQRYPFGVPEAVTDVPAKYENLQCQLAYRYWLRQGIEGQLISVENGVHKHYESADDMDLLKQIMQVCKVG